MIGSDHSKLILTSHIEPNKFNPNMMDPETFKALKLYVLSGEYDAILISPKNVFYGDSSLPRDRYVIVDGEHKWRAAVEQNIPRIASDIKNVTEKEARVICYVKDAVRGQIDPIKEAQLFQIEIKDGLTEEQVAQRYTKSRSYIASRLQLLKIAEPVKQIFQGAPTPKEKKAVEEALQEVTDVEEEEPKEFTVKKTPSGFIPEPVEDIEPKRLVPRVTVTASHLEAIASLPQSEQVEVAKRIVDEDLSVRDAENVVRDVKARLEKERRIADIMARAKRTKCPKCGGRDVRLVDWVSKDSVQCQKCFTNWEPLKSQAEVDKERKENLAEYEKKERAERVKKMLEARESPGYIKRPENLEELRLKVTPWALAKLRTFTDIAKIEVTGKIGAKSVRLQWGEASYGGNGLYLVYNVSNKKDDFWGGQKFGFSAETKDYKRGGFKSKLDLPSDKHGEADRQELIRFLEEVSKTDADPWEEKP